MDAKLNREVEELGPPGELIGRIIVSNQPFELCSRMQKGDLGEGAVELCLILLGLRKKRDYRSYEPSDKERKIYHPDFSDEKTFVIEAKNLSLKSEMSSKWVEEEVLTRFGNQAVPAKILVIFGGILLPSGRKRLKKEKIYLIRYHNPISVKDHENVIWWLKDKLLEISQFRKKVIAVNAKRWNPNSLRTLGDLNEEPFFNLYYDNKKQRFTLITFTKGTRPSKVWNVSLRKMEDSLKEEKVSWIDWRETK